MRLTTKTLREELYDKFQKQAKMQKAKVSQKFTELTVMVMKAVWGVFCFVTWSKILQEVTLIKRMNLGMNIIGSNDNEQ